MRVSICTINSAGRSIWAGHLGGVEFHRLPFGALIGTVRLVECRRAELVYPGWDRQTWQWPMKADALMGNFDAGRWAWLCADAKVLDAPVPWRGAQGLFDLPATPAELAAAQVGQGDLFGGGS